MLNLFKSNKPKKLVKEEKVNPMKVYGDLIFSHVSNGLTESCDNLELSANKICYSRVFTEDKIVFYIQVASFASSELSPNILSCFRNSLRKLYSHKVYVDLISCIKPHKIKWESRDMKSNVSMWRNRKKLVQKERQENGEDSEDFQKSYNKREDERQERLAESWTHYQHCEEVGHGIGLVSIVFRIKIPKEDNKYCVQLFDAISDTAKKYNLNCKQLELCLYDAIDSISPFKHEVTKLGQTFIADRVLTTPITSTFTPITQGELPKGDIVLGMDIKNNKLVMLDTHPENQDGSNILVIGLTGSGKSFLIKVVLEQSLLTDYLYITDYEGSEYTAFGEAYGATFLDLNGKDGKYYEPLNFYSTTMDKSKTEDLKRTAIDCTFQLVTVLMGKPLSSAQKNILSRAIEEHAKYSGVDFDNPVTWVNSKNMSVKKLLPRLDEYIHSETEKGKYGSDLTELQSTLELYFRGVRSYMFKNPISFDELKEERILITRFGADSTKSLTSEESIELRVKQLTKMLLDAELARYRRSKGQSFIMLYEELQRYLNHEGAGDWLNTIWTGIRKSNGTCIGIINDPEKLNCKISGLINNTKYFLIGQTQDLNSMDYLFKNPQLASIKGLVENLINLNRCFVFKYKNAVSVFRCEVPKSYAESEILSTRNDGKKK